MKNSCRVLLALALTAFVSIPVCAASVVVSDSFSKNTPAAWESDQKDPAKWDTEKNYLSITVGRGTRPVTTPKKSNNVKSGIYDVQGKKLALKKPTSSTWTASVKLNADSDWFSSSSNRHSAVLRLDLVDGNGNPIPSPAALALEKRAKNLPVWACYNPELLDGWSYPKLYTGTNAGLMRKELEVEEGWHTLYIKCDRGYITYQIDGKILTSFDIGVSDVYPAYAALGAADFGYNFIVDFDSFILYNGNVGAVKKILTEEEEEDKESSREEKYDKRRDRWIEAHTEYMFYNSDGTERWERAGNLTDEQKSAAWDRRRVGDEPDWFDDY